MEGASLTEGPCPTLYTAGSLDSFFALYRRLLPSLGGYLTHAGELHRGRLEALLAAVAETEADVLAQRAQVQLERVCGGGGVGVGGGGGTGGARRYVSACA